MVTVRAEASKQKEGLNDVAKVLYVSEKQVEEKKKAAASFAKEKMLLERKYKKRKADLEKKVGCPLQTSARTDLRACIEYVILLLLGMHVALKTARL